jgi:Transglutaminase-like superfamily
VAWLKPADPLDLLALTLRFELPEWALTDRAAALGCRHTWPVFAQRCADLELEDGPARQTLRRARRLDGYSAPDGTLSRLGRAPAALLHTLRALPDALAVRRLATGGDPRQLPGRWTLATPRRPAVLAVPAALGGADRALKLLYPRLAFPVGATCVPRALTRYAALTRAGVPVSFVSGVAQTAKGVVGHAWIELEAELDAEYGEPEARGRYRVLFRHAATAERPELGAGDPT